MAATELTLTPEYEVTKDNGVAVITVKDENFFVAEAEKAGIEKSMLEKVSKFKETYLHAAIEAATAEVQTVLGEDKDLKEAEVTTPYGTNKSTNIVTHVLRSKTMRVPGDGNKTITKSVVKNFVNSKEYNYPKTRRKALEAKLTEALLAV